MFELFLFFSSLLLILSISYTLKIFKSSKNYSVYDVGRIVDKNGKPTRQIIDVVDI